MKTHFLMLASMVPAVIGCGGPFGPDADNECQVVAIYLEPAMPLPATNEDEDTRLPTWPATAIVVANPSVDGVGLICPATLFLTASPNQEARLSELVCWTCMAIPCRNAGIRGKWLHSGKSVFVFAYDCGGTSGKRVLAFEHTVSCWDGAQDHCFYQIMDEESRLPVYLADVVGDGTREILVASLIANVSGAADTPRTYRVFSIEGGAAKMLKELDEEAVLSLKDLESL